MDFQKALDHLNHYRNMLINKIERETTVRSITMKAQQDFNAAIGKHKDPYTEHDDSYRLDAIKTAFTMLRDRVADFILYGARYHSGQQDYDPVVPEWINEYAPLFSNSDLSAVHKIWYRESRLSQSSFDTAKALLANYDLYQLGDLVRASCTPEHAEKKVYQEAAKEIVDHYGLSRITLQSLLKEHKQGFVLSKSIYSRPNEWSHRSSCKREWAHAASDVYRLQKNLEKVSAWAEDDVFMDIARVFNELISGHNHDIYYDSRDKFESGKVKLTMFNEKYELLVPKSAVSQLVGFLRTYADGYLYKPAKAA